MTVLDDLSPAVETFRKKLAKAQTHRPLLAQRVRPLNLKEIIAKPLEPREPMRSSAHTLIEFVWDDPSVRERSRNAVYVATLHINNLAATHEQVQQYQAIGVPCDEIVIVGDYRDLPHQSYAALKRTGAILKRVHEPLNDATRARVQRELTPIFDDIFHLTPPPVRTIVRPHTPPMQDAIPLDLEGINRLAQRISDRNYEATDE